MIALDTKAICSRWRLSLLRAVIILSGIIAAGLGGATGLASHVAVLPAALTVGRVLATTALGLFMLQFALGSRLRLLDRAFGLDVLYRFHAIVGIAAAVLASAHPFLIYWSKAYAINLDTHPWTHYWREFVGAGALLLVWVIVCSALWRVFLGLGYQAWRWVHRLTFVLVLGALIHAFSIGVDFENRPWVWWTWNIAAGAYAAMFVWVMLIRPALTRRMRFEVRRIRRLNSNIVEVTLGETSPAVFSFLPGQFAFVRFYSESVSREEHPFTLSSSPLGDEVALTIKQSGDFTARIDRLATGDKAVLMGPFGRFCHLLRSRPDEPLVMIAGGIGITPMLSMLRYLAVAEPDRCVTLIWANRTEADIVLRDEIGVIDDQMVNLSVHHVLSREVDFSGEKGHVNSALLQRLVGADLEAADVFVCGPGAMMSAARKALRMLGVKRRRIHDERFALAGSGGGEKIA